MLILKLKAATQNVQCISMKNVTQIIVLYYHRKVNHISMLIKDTDYNYSPLVKLWDIGAIRFSWKVERERKEIVKLKRSGLTL